MFFNNGRFYLPLFIIRVITMLRLFLSVGFLFFFNPAFSTTFVIPASGDMVGEIQYTSPEPGETLSDVGIRYDVGYFEMIRVNPQVDPLRPLPLRTRLIIPSQYLLPPGPREGIVINLAEYRLYYYPPGDNVVVTMPVGIGREGWHTPTGKTSVTVKERDPVWHPTANVRAEAAKNGTPIPDEFPAGEGNPLGRHVLRLGWPTYLIHGTNRRDGVGSRVSAGCIRMMPEDIEQLFEMVAVGTRVTVMNEPLKLGLMNGQLYVQVHPGLTDEKKINLQALLQEKLNGYALKKTLNKPAVSTELQSPSGMPVKISA